MPVWAIVARWEQVGRQAAAVAAEYEVAEAGVIYLRGSPRELAELHAELVRLLAEHSANTLGSSFVVVEPSRHRLRRLPA